MSDTKHSPLPWAVDADLTNQMGDKPLPSVAITEPEGDLIVADVWGDVTQLDAAANAAYIVRCVNSHERLVEALRRILPHALDARYPEHPDIMFAADAIAEAEGGAA